MAAIRAKKHMGNTVDQFSNLFAGDCGVSCARRTVAQRRDCYRSRQAEPRHGVFRVYDHLMVWRAIRRLSVSTQSQESGTVCWNRLATDPLVNRRCGSLQISIDQVRSVKPCKLVRCRRLFVGLYMLLAGYLLQMHFTQSLPPRNLFPGPLREAAVNPSSLAVSIH